MPVYEQTEFDASSLGRLASCEQPPRGIYVDRIASVIILFTCGRPLHVAGFIISIIVLALK